MIKKDVLNGKNGLLLEVAVERNIKCHMAIEEKLKLQGDRGDRPEPQVVKNPIQD